MTFKCDSERVVVSGSESPGRAKVDNEKIELGIGLPREPASLVEFGIATRAVDAQTRVVHVDVFHVHDETRCRAHTLELDANEAVVEDGLFARVEYRLYADLVAMWHQIGRQSIRFIIL